MIVYLIDSRAYLVKNVFRHFGSRMVVLNSQKPQKGNSGAVNLSTVDSLQFTSIGKSKK